MANSSASLTNAEILEIYLDNGLIRRCIECQFSKVEDKQFMDDFFQDLCLIILEYDNEKLNNAHRNKHFNAFITRIIINNIFSNTSPYYRQYYKFMDKSNNVYIDVEGEEIIEL